MATASRRVGIERIPWIRHLAWIRDGEAKSLGDGIADVAETSLQGMCPKFLGVRHLSAKVIEGSILASPHREVRATTGESFRQIERGEQLRTRMAGEQSALDAAVLVEQVSPGDAHIGIRGGHPLVLAAPLLAGQVHDVPIGTPAADRYPQRVLAGEQPIEAGEQIRGCAAVVEILEAHRIKEAIRAARACAGEIAERVRAPLEPEICLQRRIPRHAEGHVPRKARLPQASFGGHVHHGRGLAAEFGRDAAGDDFHARHAAGIQAAGEGVFNLIADGHAVHHVGDLAVAALEIESPVRVRREAWCGKQDALHGLAPRRRRNLLDHGLVHVQVGGHMVFDEGRTVLHHHGHLAFLQHQVHGLGQGRMNLQVAMLDYETRRPRLQVIVAERNVEEREVAVGIRLHRLAITADFIFEAHHRPLDGLALLVLHGACEAATGRQGHRGNRRYYGLDRAQGAGKHQQACETGQVQVHSFGLPPSNEIEFY